MSDDYEKKHRYSDTENYDTDGDIIYSDEEEENERIKEYEYYSQTVDIINKSLQNYVNEKSLPLCEYMTCKKIDKFINKNLN